MLINANSKSIASSSSIWRPNGVFILLIFLSLPLQFMAQTQIVISIKKFGAKGDGVANDQMAFEKASEFINARSKNIKLVIPKGVYIVGKQTPSTGVYLAPTDVISLRNCTNITIEGGATSKIVYQAALKFGSFNPKTNQAHYPPGEFYDRTYTAQIGRFIALESCNSVTLSKINVDGNNDNMDFGGTWGDKGIQLMHYGIFMNDCSNVNIKDCNVSHFACDGLCIYGSENFTIANSKFEYNTRQGFSWVGGKKLKATNCSFSFTGYGKMCSSPGAGLDVECEVNDTISNGVFTNCKFVDNCGPAVVAESGASRNIKFNNCLFWGIKNWSIWVTKPDYVFTDCKIYGSVVHGFNTTSFKDATKFYNCDFEDKPYNGKSAYGGYLAEIDGKKMMIFENCTFTSNVAKALWYGGYGTVKEEQAIIRNCTFNIKNANLISNDFYALIRRANLENLKFNHYFTQDKKYYLAGKDENAYMKNLEFKYISK
jgi:parallel beta-helix repeat protein